MAKTSKSASTKPVDTPVPVVPPVVDEPIKEVKEVVKKTKKSKKVDDSIKVTESTDSVVVTPLVATTTPSVSNVVVQESSGDVDVVVPVAAVSTETTIASKLSDFNVQLQQLFALLQTVRTQYRVLDKSVNKELKAYYKASSKKHKRSGNRQPSGFVRPTLISDELAAFLGKEVGTEMARTEVSKEINQYIRTHSLQDKANGRNILPDAKLTELLKLKEGDLLSYFNLQKYMKHHFIKSVVPPVDVSVPVPPVAVVV
jgi:chromatin remodeling complex protein RSC6